MRLHSIKSQILSILRLEQAPNISRDTVKLLLPKAPPLQELLNQYDQNGGISEDEEQGSSETIITMATERKYRCYFVCYFVIECNDIHTFYVA